MDAAHGKRIIALVPTTGDRGPVVDDLRAHGYEARVAPDWQAARQMLAAGEADFVLCDADTALGPAVMGNEEAVHLKAAIGGVVRDLRNLLNTLAESIDELFRLTSATPFAGRAETLVRTRRRILRAQDFLADLLAEIWNGAGLEGRIVDADLEDLVEGAAITVYSEASRKDQRLVLNIDSQAGRVRADPAKLKRVLTNLLGSAVRNAPVAGTVTVEARREGSDCLISVSDSGEGISRESLPHFFRVPESGDAGEFPQQAGPGLSIVKRLVDQHGGRVWVESDPGRGTTVFVALPQPARRTENRTRRVNLPSDGQEDRE
jgi:signal transduction histidine kinase